ncbi:MAG: type III-B CRISPR module RAMP protein Cmr6 [Thermoproteota archaeon]|nr:MAG: type III-B CRISPR module RAMP protein Cmr6 [Candidatus Korarchaeota archaeon]
MMMYPSRVSEIVRRFISSAAMRGDKVNVGLLLDKYVFVHESGEIELRDQLRRLVGRTAPLRIPSRLFYLEAFDELLKRIDCIANSLSYSSRQETLELVWRLVVNLGAASVYETSILLHRSFSIPYIPGSALKGACRCWALMKFQEHLKVEPSELEKKLEEGEDIDASLNLNVEGFPKLELEFKDLIDMFGYKDSSGKVIFLDAVPLRPEKDFLVLDIMNVHYRDYYERGAFPGDWMNPNIVFFLAVEGLKFKFTLLAKEGYESLLDKAMALLIEALEKIGVGAKTSVGYGYFRRVS